MIRHDTQPKERLLVFRHDTVGTGSRARAWVCVDIRLSVDGLLDDKEANSCVRVL